MFLILFVGTVLAYFTMSWWMPRPWYRALLYPGGKPNGLARCANRVSDWVSALGMAPGVMVSLETQGRLTGRPSRVPLVVAQWQDKRYLVSMLGESAQWVQNVRASHGEAVLRRGVVEPVLLVEVAITERPPILRAYLGRAPGARPHFDIAMDASLADFARVAGQYPVFQILPRDERFGGVEEGESALEGGEPRLLSPPRS